MLCFILIVNHYPFLVNPEYARHCMTRNSYNACNASKSYCIHLTA
jgi:hypothetical protein